MMRLLVSTAAVFLMASAVTLHGQRGGRGAAPTAPREAAVIDLTGYWVSVVTEDWKYRMVTPRKGVYDTLTLNAEGRKVGDSWDPAKDEAAGELCKAYGAPSIMRHRIIPNFAAQSEGISSDDITRMIREQVPQDE